MSPQALRPQPDHATKPIPDVSRVNHRRAIGPAVTCPADVLVGGLEAVEVRLVAGDVVLAQPGALVALFGQADFRAVFQGGLWRGLLRRLSGERFWRQQIRAKGPARAVFSDNQPGGIVHIALRGNTAFLADRGRWLASVGAVELAPHLERRVTTAIFGGLGFVRQRLSGTGDAYLQAVGAVIDYVLPEGVSALVQSSALVAIEETVTFEAVLLAGVTTGLFGGEGWFLTKLTGPGRVILQTLDPAALRRPLRTSTSSREATGHRQVREDHTP